jgi:uncharacterized protein YlaI
MLQPHNHERLGSIFFCFYCIGMDLSKRFTEHQIPKQGNQTLLFLFGVGVVVLRNRWQACLWHCNTCSYHGWILRTNCYLGKSRIKNEKDEEDNPLVRLINPHIWTFLCTVCHHIETRWLTVLLILPALKQYNQKMTNTCPGTCRVKVKCELCSRLSFDQGRSMNGRLQI